MFRRVVLLLLVVALCYAYAEVPVCPPNEHFNGCGGRGCEPRCDSDDQITCPPVCEEGCYCNHPRVRDNGVCILPEHCEKLP